MGGAGGTEDGPDEADGGAGDRLDAGPSAAAVSGRARRPRGGRVRSEVLGLVVLLVLALVCAGLIAAVVVKTKQDAARAAREAASYTPPPIASPSAGSDGRPVIALVTDETATKAASGIGAAQRWPRLLATDLDARVTTIASTGAGFTAGGNDGRTFVEAASEVPDDADLVVFVGGGADAGSTSLAIARAATRAFSAAKEQAPDAAVIVVGPLFVPSDTTAADVRAVRTALESSAGIAGADWVDPISAKWLTGVEGASDLGAEDEDAIGSRVGSVLQDALD